MRTSIILIAVVLAAACKPETASPPEPPPETTAPAEPDADAKSVAGDEIPPEAAGKMCSGEDQKLDATQRAAIRELQAPWIATRKNALVVEYIEAVRKACSAREPGRLGEIAEATYEKMAPLYPDRNESHQQLLAASATGRAQGYLTCRSITDDDPTWCDLLAEDAGGGPGVCQSMHSTYRRIFADALKGGEDCTDAMKDAPAVKGMEPATWTAMCNAVKSWDASLCPADTDPAAYHLCMAVVDRSEKDWCKTEKPDDDAHEDCCRKLRYRFSLVMADSPNVHFSPETGALSGDADGCERALVWGLYSDLQPLLAVPGDEPSPPPAPPEQCTYAIQWSMEPLPGL